MQLGVDASVRPRTAELCQAVADHAEVERMTCYQRHLLPLFEAPGLEYEADSRKGIDTAIRLILDLSEDARCPQVWSAPKALPPQDFESLPSRVSESLAESGAV